jgi:ABC-type sugar transport system substrate-binding protein
MSDIWNEYSARAFEYAATRAGRPVNVIIVDSRNSPEESINAMQSLILQGVDGISIFPVTPESGAQQIRMANAAGIPVTVENVMMDIPNPGDFIGAIACRYEDIGYAAIRYIAESRPGARIFFNAGGRGLGVFEMYQVGVDMAMAALGNRVNIVATLNGDWLTEAAFNNTVDLINSGTQFDYVFANNGMIAMGTHQALRARNMSIPIVSTGGSPDDFQMLRDGVQSANMTAPVSIQGVQTFKNLYDFIVYGRRPAEQRQALPIIPITRNNLSEFIAWDDFEAAYRFVYGR